MSKGAINSSTSKKKKNSNYYFKWIFFLPHSSRLLLMKSLELWHQPISTAMPSFSCSSMVFYLHGIYSSGFWLKILKLCILLDHFQSEILMPKTRPSPALSAFPVKLSLCWSGTAVLWLYFINSASIIHRFTVPSYSEQVLWDVASKWWFIHLFT